MILNYICKFKSYYNEEGDSYDSFTDDILTHYKKIFYYVEELAQVKVVLLINYLKKKEQKKGKDYQ